MACQQAPFSNEPSRGSIELVWLLAEAGKNILTVWNQCSIDDNCSNEQKSLLAKGDVSQEMTNASVVYKVLLLALPSRYVQVQG